VLHRVAALNRIRHGIVYLQITRGVAPRNHAFPSGARPNWVVTAARRKPLAAPGPGSGVRVVGIPDQRWVRRDIKSVSLLPNVLGKEIAARAGAYEAWQIDPDGTITEGTSSNAWIVTREGEIVTRAASAAILNGVTRLALLSVAAELSLRFVERSFTLEEAKAAAEAFITSTTSLAVPVIRIDETVIGDGRPGPVVLTLGAALLARYDAEALA
jgi:D-alanine transaminase